MMSCSARLRTVFYNITLPFYLVLLLPHFACFILHKNRTLLIQDLEVWIKRSNLSPSYFISLIYLLRRNNYFRNIFYYRIDSFCAFFLNLYLPENKSFIISRQAQIEGGFFAYHPYGTIINARYIGRGCTVRHLSTFGNKSDDNQMVPTILDNVTFGASVTVIGDIVIGSNSIIGAGSIVTRDIPSDSVAAGNPARVLKKNTHEGRE